MSELRWYQREAVEAIQTHLHLNPLVCLPTGSGKSHVIAEIVRWAINGWSDTRILILAHVKELLQQNAQKITDVWVNAPIGVYCAGLGSKRARQITVASIQSIYNKTPSVGAYELVIVDEAHLIPKRDDGMYREFISAQKAVNPDLKIIGLTATPFRMKTGLLYEGDNKLFDQLVYNCKLTPLIEQGFLCPIVGRLGRDQADLSGVHLRHGEFKNDEMEAVFSEEELIKKSVAEILELGKDRKSMLIFCAGIDHAEKVNLEFRKHGIKTMIVTGKTKPDTREYAVNAFKNQDIRSLINCAVYTTGFDAPGVDLIALLRATKSPGLYVQMVGRGLRIAPNKTDCLLLDYGLNIRRHGALEDIVVTDQDGDDSKEERKLSKTCRACGLENPIYVKVCKYCGAQLTVEHEISHEVRADNSDPIRGGTEVLDVLDVYYKIHKGKSGIDSLRVSYRVGFDRWIAEWVCFEHEGYARQKAVEWSRRRGINPVPETIWEAYMDSDKFIRPKRIAVKKEGKYERITSYEF